MRSRLLAEPAQRGDGHAQGQRWPLLPSAAAVRAPYPGDRADASDKQRAKVAMLLVGGHERPADVHSVGGAHGSFEAHRLPDLGKWQRLTSARDKTSIECPAASYNQPMCRGVPALCIVTASFLVSACASSSAAPRGSVDAQQWTGIITQLQPLCVGRYAASGDCFNGPKDAAVRANLHVGECVEVTYTPSSDGYVRAYLQSIVQVPASSDPMDCEPPPSS